MRLAQRIAAAGCELQTAGLDRSFLRPISHAHRAEALSETSASERPGGRVGPYVLRALLGRGGMNSVWLAQHIDGRSRRRVALKVAMSWLVSGEQLQRERDILTTLEHPNIVRLSDGGISAAGRPYLVLEYVDGETLDAYCAARQLAVEARVRLLVQAASALSYAHARLIVHGDLKPTNILVGRDGRVRLIDFGNARRLDAAGRSSRDRALALTRAYASPEQIAARPIGIASDVYSLGVVLYELLVGARPYPLAKAADARAPSEARGPDRQLRRRPRGDLDAIALKALAKEPSDRYANIEALTLDLERHLAGLSG